MAVIPNNKPRKILVCCGTKAGQFKCIALCIALWDSELFSSLKHKKQIIHTLKNNAEQSQTAWSNYDPQAKVHAESASPNKDAQINKTLKINESPMSDCISTMVYKTICAMQNSYRNQVCEAFGIHCHSLIMQNSFNEPWDKSGLAQF